MTGVLDLGGNLRQDLHAIPVEVVCEGQKFVSDRSTPATALLRARRVRRQNAYTAKLFDLRDGLVRLLIKFFKDVFTPLLVLWGVACWNLNGLDSARFLIVVTLASDGVDRVAHTLAVLLVRVDRLLGDHVVLLHPQVLWLGAFLGQHLVTGHLLEFGVLQLGSLAQEHRRQCSESGNSHFCFRL